MSTIFEVYERFVAEENQICRRIETLDIIQSSILSTVYKYGPELDTLTAEDVLMAVHRIHQDLLTELIHVRLEKSVLSHRHEHYGIPKDEAKTSEDAE